MKGLKIALGVVQICAGVSLLAAGIISIIKADDKLSY